MQLNLNASHAELVQILRHSKRKVRVEVYTSLGFVSVSKAEIIKRLARYALTSRVFYNMEERDGELVISMR